MKPRSNGIVVALVIVVLILIGWAMYAGTKGSTSAPISNNPGEPVICTMDAMLCPDGSYVGRIGPNCQFAACPLPTTPFPSASSTVIVDARLSQLATVLGLSFTPVEILEDSRCPMDVQCIQAGTVRLRATVGSTSVILALNKVVAIQGITLELADVTPLSRATVPIVSGDYRFKIRASRGTVIQ